MKNNLITFTLLGAAALLMGGCQTTRTASFPGHDYNTVFKNAVSGLCSEKKLLVYKADKARGVIWVQGRGIFANPPETPVILSKASDGSASARITVPGMNNPWPDRMLELITGNLPAAKQGVSKSPGKRTLEDDSDLDLEKQKLELEKQKLQLEKDKFEFEKQKQKGK
ncbi:MAG: hypothetical protein PHV36_11930 [Elusimicrobiales bacterium]|nr:hypothetical protein [Elusimicrobiales bacterium]